MISHVSVCLLAHEKMFDFKHFLTHKTHKKGVQLFGSSDWLYSRFFICFRHYQAFPFPLHFLSCQRLRH